MSEHPSWSELLSRAPRAGVYRAPASGIAGLAAAAEDLHYPCLLIDFAGCRDKACLLDRVARALAFPDWFGHNWDALADCLTDLDWMPAAGYVLLIDHGADLAAAVEADFLTALAVFEEAAGYWRDEGVPFWVFVDTGSVPSTLPALQ